MNYVLHSFCIVIDSFPGLCVIANFAVFDRSM